MNFSNLKEWKTPRGNVVELAIDGKIAWKKGTSVGGLSVGSSVFLNVGGVRTEFLVVHQGNPDTSLYDVSCNGTWLLMKDIYTKNSANSRDYSNSLQHNYLNGEFFALLDNHVSSAIKQVKIPYTVSIENKKTTVYSGVDGLSTKIFLLSIAEVGYGAGSGKDGNKLSYFADGDVTKRIAYYNGAECPYHTRTTSKNLYLYLLWLSNGYSAAGGLHDDPRGVRPAFILPSSTRIDENFSVIA